MALVLGDSLISVAGLISIPVILWLHADGCVASNCLKRGRNRCRVCFPPNNTYVHIHDWFCQHVLQNLAATVAGCVCQRSSLVWPWRWVTASKNSARSHDCTQLLQNTHIRTHRCCAGTRLWIVLSRSGWLISVPVLFAFFFFHPARALPGPTTPLHN